jgi:hypothetical protein
VPDKDRLSCRVPYRAAGYGHWPHLAAWSGLRGNILDTDSQRGRVVVGTAISRVRGRFARAAAAVGLSVTAFLAAGAGPARAADRACQAYEVSYGITRVGALVEHDYCVGGDAAGMQAAPRQVAPAGWWLGGAVLSAGTDPIAEGQPAKLYQVAADGTLWWYTDGGQGRFGPGKQVGRVFGDWRRYRTLFAPSPGLIDAVDETGRVLEWIHLGYTDGSDTWQGPEVVGHGFAGRRPVTTAYDESGNTVFLGTDPSRSCSITYWASDGRVLHRERIVGSPEPTGLSRGFGLGLFGRGPGGTMVRLDPRPPYATPRQWVPQVLGTRSDRYARVVGGGVRGAITNYPYEWQ